MNKLFTVMGGKFKFQVQDRDLEYLFWQCEKHIALSEKKTTLANTYFPLGSKNSTSILALLHLSLVYDKMSGLNCESLEASALCTGNLKVSMRIQKDTSY